MADGIARFLPERKLEVRSGSSAVPYSRLLNSTEKTTGASEINKLTVALFFSDKKQLLGAHAAFADCRDESR